MCTSHLNNSNNQTGLGNIKDIWDSKLDGPVTKNIVYPEVIIDSVRRYSPVQFLALKIGNQQLKPIVTGILKKQLKMVENCVFTHKTDRFRRKIVGIILCDA